MAIMFEKGKLPKCGAFAYPGFCFIPTFEQLMTEKALEVARIYGKPEIDFKPVYDETKTDDTPVYEMKTTPPTEKKEKR